jgi:hypothetical protein
LVFWEEGLQGLEILGDFLGGEAAEEVEGGFEGVGHCEGGRGGDLRTWFLCAKAAKPQSHHHERQNKTTIKAFFEPIFESSFDTTLVGDTSFHPEVSFDLTLMDHAKFGLEFDSSVESECLAHLNESLQERSNVSSRRSSYTSDILPSILAEPSDDDLPSEYSVALHSLYHDLRRVLDDRTPSTGESFLLESRYTEVVWIQKFRWREGRPLWGYICITEKGGRVLEVKDIVQGGLKRTVMIGHVSGYPCSGAGVHYCFEEDFLYLELDEEEDVSRKSPRNVYPWVGFTRLLENPEDV